LKSALSLTDADFVTIPALCSRNRDYSARADAYIPGIVNLLAANANVIMAKPFGPRDSNGKDVFEEHVKTKLHDDVGVPLANIHFLDDWDSYHRELGEVHCGTNARRTPHANVRWWR